MSDNESYEFPSVPQAVQIVSISNNPNDPSEQTFQLNGAAMDSILSRVDPEMKISVVSVVGAFRTGKSFLLSWFLRYLRGTSDLTSSAINNEWVKTGGDSITGDGFHWRGGEERDTTGLWMWSEVFTRVGINGEKIGVLLVDTQGMFDCETTMGLTAAIFGLSTLLSSFMIYNVDKRIQEDNLQQLALFSEYGRMALVSDNAREGVSADKSKPFQRIEFVVRDWQNFDDDTLPIQNLQKSMDTYLQKVIRSRPSKDLQETREQITNCFEKIGCYLLPHPGFSVTKKTYDGSVSQIEDGFLRLLGGLCGKVFGHEMEPKRINGRDLTAGELGEFVKAYSEMFHGGGEFPEATTMLAATAAANNKNALTTSLAMYRREMDRLSGPDNSNYVKPEEFAQHAHACQSAAVEYYSERANFGGVAGIENGESELLTEIYKLKVMYQGLNDQRNPLAGMETYMLPLAIGFLSFALRWFADLTCSSWSDTCRAGSDFLGQVYSIVFIFLSFMAATRIKQIGEYVENIKTVVGVMNGGGGGNLKRD